MLEKLYMDNRGLIGMWVGRYAFLWREDPVCDADDLMHAGFLGLVAAAQTFDPEKASWTTWASFYIRRAILDELRARRRRPRTVSLDLPLGDDADGDALRDLIPDESMPDADEDLQRIATAQAVRNAIQAIPSEQRRRALELVRLEGKTLKEAGELLSVPVQQVCTMNRKSLQELRRNRDLQELAELDGLTRFHARKSITSFRRDWSSAVEDAVIWREEQRAKHGKNQDETP